MISVVERLVESWLDSQTERRYQPAFIQLLASEGWTVLHNTRHSPIELGKDVIARDPEGVLYCFQLKGNPGSRVTKSEAQGLLHQFIELLEAAPDRAFRRSPRERHVAVFVTNGEIDEEARLLFERTGERTETVSCPAQRYELWSRGTLLQKFAKAAGRVWPTSLDGTRLVLNLYAGDGRENPESQTLARLFAATAIAPAPKDSAASKDARLADLLVLAEIVKAPWYTASNHYGLYSITVLASVYALRFADSPKRLSRVQGYAALALDHCADLINEAQALNFEPGLTWHQRDPLSEIDIVTERTRLLGDCAATLVLGERQTEQKNREYIARLLEETFFVPRLWGFGAVPALLVRYWAVCRIFAEDRSEQALATQLQSLIMSSLGRLSTSPLPGPYYSFIDCWAYRNGFRHIGNNSVFHDDFEGRVWFGRAMLFMLAKRNRKQSCRTLWPWFSRCVHEEPHLPSTTFFDASLSREGETRTFTLYQETWRDLLLASVDNTEGEFLTPFVGLEWLISAYISIVPYRAWTGVLMWLDTKLNRTWYREDYLPPPY